MLCLQHKFVIYLFIFYILFFKLIYYFAELERYYPIWFRKFNWAPMSILIRNWWSELLGCRVSFSSSTSTIKSCCLSSSFFKKETFCSYISFVWWQLCDSLSSTCSRGCDALESTDYYDELTSAPIDISLSIIFFSLSSFLPSNCSSLFLSFFFQFYFHSVKLFMNSSINHSNIKKLSINRAINKSMHRYIYYIIHIHTSYYHYHYYNYNYNYYYYNHIKLEQSSHISQKSSSGTYLFLPIKLHPV